MNLIAGFNWLDFVIIFLIIAGIAIGLRQGLLRQIIGLAALYIGTILGAQYYRVIGGWIRTLVFQSAAPNNILNAFSFFVILILVSSIINWLAYDAYRSTKLQLAPLLDQLGGAVLGLITMIILISIMLLVLGFGTSEPWPWNEPARQFIADGMQSFRLLPVFNELKPLLLSVLGPWLPAGLPSLFDLA